MITVERDVYLNRCGYPSGPYKTGPREINATSNLPMFVMARSLCGVPGLMNGGRAHSRTGSETTEGQRFGQNADFQSSANQVPKDE